MKNISNTQRSTEPSPGDLRIIVAMYVNNLVLAVCGLHAF
jgi:hypothetical protein